MPIVVKHGEGSADAISALAVLANAMAAAGKRQPLQMGPGAGGGGGGGGRRIPTERSWLERPGVHRGYGDQLQQKQREEADLAKMQEAARLQDEQWEKKYTIQQRQEIQKINDSVQAVQQSADMSPDEKEAALRILRAKKLGISPSEMPRDPTKFQWPKGTGPGILWRDELSGALVTGGFDAHGNPTIKLVQRDDQGPEAAKRKIQADAEKQAAEDQRAREEKIMEIRTQLILEPKKTRDELGTVVESHRSDEEVQQELERIFPELRQREPEPEGGPMAQAAEEGLRIEKMDLDLPEEVAYAQAYLRTKGDFDKLSKKEKMKWLQMYGIMKQFQASQQSQQIPGAVSKEELYGRAIH